MPVSDAKRDKDQQEFEQRVNKVMPKPPLLKNVLWAFVVGGLICVVGQVVQDCFVSLGMPKKEAAGPTSAVMIFLGAFFTGWGIYDELGKRAGAGSAVPITGFANSIVAPAMEFKREGYIFGIGAKMFVIAGPVLVYGLLTSFIIGLIYWWRQ